MLASLTKYVIDQFGFKTNRKLLAIWSDDWGCIRLKDASTREHLKSQGLNLDSNRFDQFDCLEREGDLQSLFEVLTSYRDHIGNHPVITALTNVANPDFEKIRASEFTEYFYEPFTETLKNHGREGVFSLYKEGINRNIFIPQFHGREHLQVSAWMRGLKQQDPKTMLSFNHNFFFLNKKDIGIDTVAGEYAEAFNFWNKTEIEIHQEAIITGTELFRRLFGFTATFFTAPVLLYHPDLNITLAKCGISILDSPRIRKEPLGKNKMRRRFSFTGQKNVFGQRFINRNVVFEPNLPGAGLDNCLSQIDRIFSSNRPAIISNHRASFSCGISADNQINGIKQLDLLIKSILKKWPETEFVDIPALNKIIDGQN